MAPPVSTLRTGTGPRKAEGGAALVEFAIILPVLMIILLGIIDLGRAYYTYESLANAAREGARTCALYNKEPDRVDRTRTRVTEELQGRIVADLAAVDCPAGSVASPIDVSVAADFLLVTPFMQEVATGAVGSNLRLQATARMAVW